MNRAQRRACRQPPPDAIQQFANTYRCPDCLSETAAPFPDELGIWHLEVRHDQTCPAYHAIERERNHQ